MQTACSSLGERIADSFVQRIPTTKRAQGRAKEFKLSHGKSEIGR
jgi:hypothetical protein